MLKFSELHQVWLIAYNVDEDVSFTKLTFSGFPCGSNGKESTFNAEDLGLIPGSGRSPGRGNDNPLQYPCLGNFMDRGAWWATVHEVAEELDMT